MIRLGAEASASAAVRELRWIRAMLVIVILGLLAAGITAFPLNAEVSFVAGLLHAGGVEAWLPALVEWIDRVHEALVVTGAEYPFLAYGTDWLAYAHIMIAIAFLGPLVNPVRNIWIVQWGVIMCLAIVPTVLIAGAVRGIPWGWQLVDSSFAVGAAIPLVIAWRLIRRREARLAAPGQAAASPE